MTLKAHPFSNGFSPQAASDGGDASSHVSKYHLRFSASFSAGEASSSRWVFQATTEKDKHGWIMALQSVQALRNKISYVVEEFEKSNKKIGGSGSFLKSASDNLENDDFFTRFHNQNLNKDDSRPSTALSTPPPASSSSSSASSIIKGQGSMTITVFEGRNLASKDLSGFSDPYCVIFSNNQQYFTSVHKKTLNPKWNEKFKL